MLAKAARARQRRRSAARGLLCSPASRAREGRGTVEGKAIAATEAQENVVEAGDIVIVAPDEKHWHGATETTAMAHVAINGPGETTPLEPVGEIRRPSP